MRRLKDLILYLGLDVLALCHAAKALIIWIAFLGMTKVEFQFKGNVIERPDIRRHYEFVLPGLLG